ncbi:MAG: divergent PAP2 family protein [Sphaerochaetaceae bacterium]|jgi:hypothetical protein
MDLLLLNRPLLAACTGMLIAQFLKPFILWAIEREFDPHLFISTGGMPSSHTAMVVALSTSIYLLYGVESVEFAICFVFSGITIHDAMGIRRAAGKQAEVINEWSRILTKLHDEGQFTPENLKTMLGHNFSQVFAGTILGLICGFLITRIF